MNDNTKPRPEVKWFAKQMERKLIANDHKPHWHREETEWLLHRLVEEVKELLNAVYMEPTVNIIDEAADVANIAMMIADNAERMKYQ